MRTPSLSSARRTKTASQTAAMLLVVALMGSGCGQFVEVALDAKDGAQETIQLAQFCLSGVQVAQSLEAREFDDAADAAQDMLAKAPEEIRDSSATVAEAAALAKSGDMSLLNSDEGRAAIEEVARFTQERCDPR